MSDESSNRTVATDSASTESESADEDADSSGGLEPGGGPRRVVSEQSVDDILDSLDETKSASASDPPERETGTTTAATSDAETDPSTADADELPSEADPAGDVTTAFDEDEIPTTDDHETDGDDAGDDEDVTAIDSDDTGTGTDSESGSNDDSSDVSELESDDGPAASLESNADSASVDAAASSLPDEIDDDASLEELAARIEDGTVTGADVRSAEAGEGREATPAVDEIDLSMDDLESTGTGSDAGRSEDERSGAASVADDAGPLAGTVEHNEAEREGSSDEEGDGDDSPGILGRIKRFFGD